MQAVIKIGSTQYLVEPGQDVLVDHLTKPEKSLVFSEVLLLIDGNKVQVGKPFIPDARVKATMFGDQKGEKIRVAKFKAKSRYRKAVGFRAVYSRIKIDTIEVSPLSPADAGVKPVKKTRQKKAV